MQQRTLYATIAVGVVATLLLLSTQVLPQVRGKIIHSFDHLWPPAGPPPVPGLPIESETGHGQSHQGPDGYVANKEWVFDHKRDKNNHGLTEAQCLTAFPLLYKEIDRAVEYRRKVGNITTDDLDMEWRHDGIVRILVRDNHVYVVDTLRVERGHRFRYLATLNSLNTAVASSQDALPNVEFTYTILDWALSSSDRSKMGRTTLAYSRDPDQESLWLMPDFGFWGWPKVGMSSYSDIRSVIDDSEDDFLDKIPKLIWRGGLGHGGEVRKALLATSEGQSWSDVYGFAWNNDTDFENHFISMEEHCDYMFTAMTEGNTWSGRLKFLLNCHSILVSHELNWLEFYHHLLVSDGDEQNYVKLDRNFTELRSTMEHLLEPDVLNNEGRRIADNARRTFRERYLTPAAVSCYWRALIHGWASVQGFEPQIWIEEEDNMHPGSSSSKKSRRRHRGTPFESYVIMEALEWEVPADPRQLVIVDKDS